MRLQRRRAIGQIVSAVGLFVFLGAAGCGGGSSDGDTRQAENGTFTFQASDSTANRVSNPFTRAVFREGDFPGASLGQFTPVANSFLPGLREYDSLQTYLAQTDEESYHSLYVQLTDERNGFAVGKTYSIAPPVYTFTDRPPSGIEYSEADFSSDGSGSPRRWVAVSGSVTVIALEEGSVTLRLVDVRMEPNRYRTSKAGGRESESNDATGSFVIDATLSVSRLNRYTSP